MCFLEKVYILSKVRCRHAVGAALGVDFESHDQEKGGDVASRENRKWYTKNKDIW